MALLALGTAVGFGPVARLASGPKSKEPRFQPIDVTTQGHFLPAYLPVGIELQAIHTMDEEMPLRMVIGGKNVRVSTGSGGVQGDVTYYRWTQSNAQFVISVAPDVPKSEIDLLIGSMRELTDAEWNALLSAFPPKPNRS